MEKSKIFLAIKNLLNISKDRAAKRKKGLKSWLIYFRNKNFFPVALYKQRILTAINKTALIFENYRSMSSFKILESAVAVIFAALFN